MGGSMYHSRLLRVAEKFKTDGIAATCGICLLYLSSWILSFFGVNLTGSTSPPCFGVSPPVRVQRDDCAAKLWLDPLEFAFAEGFRRHECNDILQITESHLDEFRQAWYRTFGDLSHE